MKLSNLELSKILKERVGALADILCGNGIGGFTSTIYEKKRESIENVEDILETIKENTND
jgi:hypothetical protein